MVIPGPRLGTYERAEIAGAAEGLRPGGLRAGGLRPGKLRGSYLPYEVVTRYEFEDNTVNHIIEDTVGDNDGDVTEPRFTQVSKVGEYSLSFDPDVGQAGVLTSVDTVSLVQSGGEKGMSMMGWVSPGGDQQQSPVGYWDNRNRGFYPFSSSLQGEWGLQYDNGERSVIRTGSEVDTYSWVHVYIGLTPDEAVLKLDGEVDISFDPPGDIADLNFMPLRAGHAPGGAVSDSYVDDVHAANATLSDGELQQVINRGE